MANKARSARTTRRRISSRRSPGEAKYAEDFRVDGMLFAKLLLSPMPHARVTQHRHERGAGDARA